MCSRPFATNHGVWKRNLRLNPEGAAHHQNTQYMPYMSVLYPYFGGICPYLYLMGDMSDMSVLNVLYDGHKNSPEVLVKFTIFYVADMCANFSVFLDLCVVYTTRGV